MLHTEAAIYIDRVTLSMASTASWRARSIESKKPTQSNSTHKNLSKLRRKVIVRSRGLNSDSKRV